MRLLICNSILIFSCLFLSASVGFAQEKSYEKFLDEVKKGFGADAEKLNKEYKIVSYDRWGANQETGELVFYDNDIPQVIASFKIAGSYSTYSNTWKWSWANDTVFPKIKKDMIKIKEFGEKREFKELITAQWECEQDYAWTMTSVAGHIINAKGSYRGKIPDGYVYLLITDIKWAKKKVGLSKTH